MLKLNRRVTTRMPLQNGISKLFESLKSTALLGLAQSELEASHISIRELQVILQILAVFTGALQAWVNRFSLSSTDGISYIEIGEAYFRGDWNAAINTYWSPLYSWLIGLAFQMFQPSPYWEFPVVKLVNFLIYLVALACFSFFLNQLIRVYQAKTTQVAHAQLLHIPEWVWVVLGYTLFIWFSIVWIGTGIDTPDMGVSACIYLAAGILLQIQTRPNQWFNFIKLGLVLAVGYLFKAAMFPMAFVFLGTSFLSVNQFKRAFPRLIAACLVFTIVAAPFITAMSISKGRLTFGDAGKMNYAWLVNPGLEEIIPDQHWQGGPPENGVPKHPTRKIFDNPAIFEFATPIGGTYAPWYNPSYWYEGLKTKFNLSKQVTALLEHLAEYNRLFLGPLVFGYVILACIEGNFKRSIQSLSSHWRLLIPALAGLAMLSLVHVKTRLIAAFVVLLIAGVFSSLRLPNSREVKRLVAGLTLAILVILGLKLSGTVLPTVALAFRGQSPIAWEVAQNLHQLGIQPGDKIALLDVEDSSWARLARVRIIAEIPDSDDYWTISAARRVSALESVRQTGVRAIVTERRSLPEGTTELATWKQVGAGYYLYQFSSPTGVALQ